MTIPSATYRIQFNPHFNFMDLYAIVDYLDELGITGLYASPLLQPTKGSSHGYDGIDTTKINPELGTLEELKKLSEKLKSKDICWIQDIVPNHLAFHTSNVWLADVLERGMNSPYAGHFDIDWEHPAYPHRLMVPFLEMPLRDCIQQQKLKLDFIDGKGFCLVYYDNYYPVKPESYSRILSGSPDEEANEVNAAISALINNASTDTEHWSKLKNDFLKLAQGRLLDRIRDNIERINNDEKSLMAIINEQYYVLCPFIESNKHINYRRFFNVNGLICLRVEDEKVFQDYHRYIHQLYKEGIIQGLRIDHIDGLRNPHEYIRRLRKLFGEDCYVIVEKILDIKEELPASMDIQGTSGYEFLSYINQVITDNKGSGHLLDLYDQYVPQNSDYDTIVFKNKLDNLETYLHGEWDNLLRYLLSLNLIDDAEIRLPNLKRAMAVFMASFPVYRVYIEQLPPDINDEELIVNSFVRATKRHPEYSYELGILRQLFESSTDPARHTNRLLFVQRLMQFTGPLAAKGVEDTTFYQYNPLISHNEVGDQPCLLGIPVRQFHEKMQDRIQRNALSFNCTSTHDTKRGEDGRVRINIISELSTEWAELVAHWKNINTSIRKEVEGSAAPIMNDEYFLYQALTGGFPEDMNITPAFIERTKRYFIKVMRESNIMSNHINPNIDYENAVLDFIDKLLDPAHEFLSSFMPFVKKITRYANTYTMVQVIIKTTAPGIPDIYQGCELWDLSYVDPDNRRPVNYDLRKDLLRQLKEHEQQDIAGMLQWAEASYTVGTQKLLVTSKILNLRRANAALFIQGEYIPIYSEGSDRVVIAYFRKLADQWILVALPLGIVADERKELQLLLPPEAPQAWTNIFTNENFTGTTLNVKTLFQHFPVAVLVQSN